ncbi:DDE superfamily endonuclease [Ceratobasidium sp. AG-Ba]|nr:DDE superfamily endonuclease [Ceratobasidium sp. AG-Ba]
MPRRTPDEVRWIIIHMHEILCYNPDTIASNLQLTSRTVRNILALWRSTGTVRTSTPLGVMGRPRLIEFEPSWQSYAQYLRERIAQSPTLYLNEMKADLQNAYGIDVHPSTISRTLKRDNITRKKCRRDAIERNEEERDAYCVRVAAIPANYLVFVDESSLDKRDLDREYGRSLQGEPVHQSAPFVRGDRNSMLPALSKKGILALEVVKGSFTADTFRNFIAKVLDKMNPYPGENSILVMDNCRIHKDPETLEMIVARGMDYIFLPPYSPDFNPIELAFSKIKRDIKRNRDQAHMSMGKENEDADMDTLGLIYQHVYSITTEHADGWFRHCHYF